MPLPEPTIQEGISLFCAVKNRSKNLSRVLRSWLSHDGVDEIVIVDWDSNDGLPGVIKEYQTGKVVVVRALEQPRWILSKAFNLAARFTRRTRILKIDADVVLGRDFFSAHPLRGADFYTGNWRLARNDNDRYLNGILYCFREDFFRVGGYNEKISAYGWDDCDLYFRLHTAGCEKKDLDLNKLIHIPHDDRDRLQYQPDVKDCKMQIQINRAHCESGAFWGPSEPMAGFRLIGQDLDGYTVEESQDNAGEILPDGYSEEAKELQDFLAVKRVLNRLQFMQYQDRCYGKGAKKTARRRVSIITSVYQGDELIESFLKNIVRQTYFHRCELILINARSPGHEEAVICEYLKRFPNILYRKWDHDPGLYSVWNAAIKMSSGEFITNANLDDRRAPQHIEKHVEALDANPEIDVVSAPLLVTRNLNETWENHAAHATWFVGFPVFYEPKDLFRKNDQGEIISQNLVHCMPVWRRSIHDRYGYFDEKNYAVSCTDWEFWLRCAVKGSRFMLLQEPLGIYHWNEKSYGRRDPKERATTDKVIKQYYKVALKVSHANRPAQWRKSAHVHSF